MQIYYVQNTISSLFTLAIIVLVVVAVSNLYRDGGDTSRAQTMDLNESEWSRHLTRKVGGKYFKGKKEKR